MKRRDFLLFRPERKSGPVELSCERLYMQYLDSQAVATPDERRSSLNTWDGEPPSELNVRDTRALFDDLDRELRSVDVVRIVGTEWLAAEGFRREFERVISAFTSRGGRVERMDR